jgi:hypothetical protein
MKKEFVPYELAVKLKELGFNEPCLAYYDVDEGYNIGYTFCYSDRESQPEIGYSAPLFQQVFRWFREKYNYNHSIVFTKHPFGTDEYQYMILLEDDECVEINFKTYEEAELACLKKLIEIVKLECLKKLIEIVKKK